MENGLYILVLPGGYYGYGVTKIAWVRRLSGDDYLIEPGARMIRRTGSNRWYEGLAAKGPGRDYKLYEPSEEAEPFSRFVARRTLCANEAAWEEHISRPGWASKKPEKHAKKK